MFGTPSRAPVPGLVSRSAMVSFGSSSVSVTILIVTVRVVTPAANVTVTDVLKQRLNHLKDKYGVAVTDNNQKAVKDADIIILAVKPQSMAEVLVPLDVVLGSLLVHRRERRERVLRRRGPPPVGQPAAERVGVLTGVVPHVVGPAHAGPCEQVRDVGPRVDLRVAAAPLAIQDAVQLEVGLAAHRAVGVPAGRRPPRDEEQMRRHRP